MFGSIGSGEPEQARATLLTWEGCVVAASAPDLSEHNRAEEPFQINDMQARSIIDNALDAIVVMNADGVITDWNRHAAEIFGWLRDEVLGKRMSETIIPEGYRAAHEGGLRRFLETGQGALLNKRVEITGLRRNGQEFPVELTVTPLPSGDSWVFHAFLRDITDRKRAEEALRASEHQLRLIVDTIPGLVAIVRPDFEIELVNRPLREYIGMGVEEMGDWTTTGIVHPHDLPRAKEARAESIAAGHPYEIEQRMRRADGVYRWFRVRGNPLRNADGGIVRWYTLLTDVEEQKRAEEVVRQNERNLRLIIDTIPALSWSTRPDGYVEFLNQRWLDFTGLSAEQAEGFGWSVVIHPEDAKGLVEYWQSALASGTHVEAEARMRRFDGVYRWFLFRADPLRDESGRIVNWYGTNFDIEDRKQAEAALRASERSLRTSEQNLRLIFDTIPALVCTMNARGETEMVNQQTYDYFGVPFEEIKNWSLSGAVHPDDLEGVVARWRHSVETGAPYDIEHRIRRSDGLYRWFHVRALPLRDQSGGILRWYVLLVDSEDRRRAEVELRSTQAELAHMTRVMTMGELTASLAHELNQPLAAVIASGDSCTAWLTNDPPQVDKARASVDRVIQAATQASAVIHRIRTMFRKAPVVRTLLNINEVIEEAVFLIQTEVSSKRISLRTELADRLPLVSADRVQMAQVILNLAMNAIEALSEIEDKTRRLSIRTLLSEGEEIHVSVADSGPGLNPNILVRLFDPFFTTKVDGMGMGLSISKSIIEAHSGRLWAEPNEPAGAVFHFALPATTSG